MLTYKCSFCDYESSRKANVKRHQDSRHRAEPVVTVDETICQICYKKFSTKYTCARHTLLYCSGNRGAPNVDRGTPSEVENAPNVDPSAPNVDRDTPLGAPNVDAALPSAPNVDATSSDEESDDTSVDIKCPNCNKTFARNFTFRRHKERCKAIGNPLQCHRCGNVFSSRSSKSHHLKHCTSNALAEMVNCHNNTTNNNIANQQNQTAETINNVNNQQNNNFNININLNNFGEESLDHITPEMLDRFVREINSGIAKCLEMIHFNPDVPQNHNIRVENIKGQLVAVFENNDWVIKDMNDTVNKMINNGCRLLSNHFYTSKALQHEDKTKHEGILAQNLCGITSKDRRYYFPVRRLVIASLHNSRRRRGLLGNGRKNETGFNKCIAT